jgi:alpha,alpha-trehalase
MEAQTDLFAEAKDILSHIDAVWPQLAANARLGSHERVSEWADEAATSFDGHLDDKDPLKPHILYLPHDFITPGGRFMVQFYWDSYFTILGLVRSGYIPIAKGMVENCFYSIDHHGMVIANRKRWAAGSQLPFLSSMVDEIYSVTRDRIWLKRAVYYIEKELNHYWMDADHLAYRGLSRFHAPTMYPASAIAAITIDHEASWDLTPRFETNDVLNLLPIDLNCNLYKYEIDLSKFWKELGDERKCSFWRKRAAQRRTTMNELFWDEVEGMYFDYNFILHKRKYVKSLAAFFTMAYGLCTKAQALQLRDRLADFEHEYGLTTCDQQYGFNDRQWNFPIGWAPLHWIVYTGLQVQGFGSDAQRIATKWLILNIDVWKRTGAIFEKYDVVIGSEKVLTDRYVNQTGFAWTNGVFIALLDEVIKATQRRDTVDA